MGMAMTLRLDDTDTAALKAYADKRGISMQQAAQEGVRTLIADERIEHIFQYVANRDRTLLDRLAQ